MAKLRIACWIAGLALLVVAGEVQADGGRVRSYLGSSAAAAESPEARAFLSELALELDRLAEAPAQRYCGTPLSQWLNENVDLLSAAGREMLKATLAAPDARPVLDTYLDVGVFRVHYSVTGPDSVRNATSDTAADGVPTYVHVAADALIRSWELLVDSIGFAPPLTDGASGGGADLYDCYLWSPLISGVIGYTEPESFFARVTGSDTIYVATSFQVVHPTMEPFPQLSDPLELLRITCAHEFFHAFHFSYDYEEKPPWQRNGWWLEGNAVWFEDYAFPDINDWSNLPPYLRETQRSITRSRVLIDLHPYGGGSIWNFYLVERFAAGPTLLLDIWTACGLVSGDNTIAATDSLLQANYGVTFDDAWFEFSNWCMRTGIRWDDSSFAQGAQWPEVPNTDSLGERRLFRYPGAAHFSDGTDTLDNIVPPGIPILQVTPSQYAVEGLGFGPALTLIPIPAISAAFRLQPNSADSQAVAFYCFARDTMGQTAAWEYVVLPEDQLTSISTWETYDSVLIVVSSGVNIDSVLDGSPVPGDRLPFLVTAIDTGVTFRESVLLEPPFPNPFHLGQGDAVHFRLVLAQPQDVFLDVFTMAGDRVRSDVIEGAVNTVDVAWDGTNQSGRQVASGLYLCKITAGNAEEVFRVGVIR